MKLHKLVQTIAILPKKFLALMMIAVLSLPLAVGFVTAVTAAPDVLMEGNTQSLNVTAGETQYKDVTSAKVDEVVQVQLWQHNREAPNTGKASNTKVKFTVPTQQGTTQVITGTTTSDNGNTISDTTTVNLSLAKARLEYMPGTAKFRYNKGAAQGDASCITGMNFPPERCYTTVAISDEVINSGVNLDQIRGGALSGCNAYHETVTIQLRAKADVVSVNKYVRHIGQSAQDWALSTTAKPGEELEYMIRFKNEGNTQLNNIMVGDNLPKYNTYEAGTTKLQNGVYPNGIVVPSDNITQGGINVGNYLPGAVGYVWFRARLDGIQAYERCGNYDIRNVGVVRPQGMNEFYNTAQVIIQVECQNQPQSAYSCDLLSASKTGTGREVQYTAKATATNNATIERYIYDFGDGTPALTTDKTNVTHTYSKDGNFATRVTVQVRANGQTQNVDSASCTASISFTTPGTPTTPGGKLPNTGPGSVVATFVAVTTVGAAGYYILARRFARF